MNVYDREQCVIAVHTRSCRQLKSQQSKLCDLRSDVLSKVYCAAAVPVLPVCLSVCLSVLHGDS